MGRFVLFGVVVACGSAGLFCLCLWFLFLGSSFSVWLVLRGGFGVVVLGCGVWGVACCCVFGVFAFFFCGTCLVLGFFVWGVGLFGF